MAFAQQNYQNRIGNCNLTIAQVGCFLTAFCNLEARYGRPIDPPTLNNFFRNNSVYQNGCDLFWSAVSRYDSNVQTTNTGSGAPPHNDCIVEFVYNGGSATHFSLVNNVADHTIVDSWDGQIRNWDYYGGPKAWASYNNKGGSPQGGQVTDAQFAAELNKRDQRMDKIENIFNLLDQTNKTVSALYGLLDQTNKRLDKLEKK